MDKLRGYEVLIEVVKNNKTHQDYKRVTELADLYYKLTTGDKIDKLLKKIITRETDEEFEQRCEITESVCPATIHSTKIVYYKACRKQPSVRKIEFKEENEKRKLELEKYIGKFWGNKSLEQYQEYVCVNYNYTDPNAFLITEFAPFNPLIEKANPYPFIATSTEAIMFEYQNEILDYLVVKLPITYLDKGTPQLGAKYTMYLGMDTIEFSQVSEDEKNNPALEIIEIEKKYYSVLYFEPKNEKVPAIRIGFIPDDETKGRTCVSIIHCGLSYLKKTLKINSELDMSASMCAFQQRFEYVSPCDNPGCSDGRMLDGATICPICKGSGEKPFHRGTQDIITLKLPRKITDITNADLIDLEKLLVYKGPLIELLDFQVNYLDVMKKGFNATLFNADLFTRSEVSVTATEKILETDNLNDTLYPFTRHYAHIWEFMVRNIATYTDLNKDLTIQYKFPFDLKMKGLTELMIELKTAKDAGASTSTISAIEDDINEILYSDRPEELKEMRIKNEINPFRGVTNADIRFVISQGNVPIQKRTLWENYESIWQDVEIENPDIFDFAITKINDLIYKKTDEYIKSITGEQDAQAEKDAKLYNPLNTGQ